MDTEDLRGQIELILHPEPDDDGTRYYAAPHSRLVTEHGLDTSYFRGHFDLAGDLQFERVLNDENDPLHVTLTSISVPSSLMSAALQLFADSIVTYHAQPRRWDVYRFYPPVLTTIWSAFEAWVRISSQLFVSTASNIPQPVKDALNETRQTVNEKGKITLKSDRRSALERYCLLLQYGCGLTVDRSRKYWQAAKNVEGVRDALVHYDVTKAPSLTASEVWSHIEAIMLLFIVPSCIIRRTLNAHQFDYYSMLVELLPLVCEFEERPLHKGWPKEGLIFYCPFDGTDENRYPRRWKLTGH